MIIESLGGMSAPFLIKGLGTGTGAAASMLAAKQAMLAPMVDLLPRSVLVGMWPAAPHMATGTAQTAAFWLSSAFQPAAGGTPHTAAFVLPPAIQQAVQGSPHAVAALLPGTANQASPAASALTAMPGKTAESLAMTGKDIVAALNTAFQDGSLALQDIGSMFGTAASNVSTPLQGTLGAVQNVLASVQNVLLPLTAGVLGGGAAQAGLNRRQRRRTEGRLGELLSRVTTLQEDAQQLREQVHSIASWIDEFQAGQTRSATMAAPALAGTSANPLQEIKGIGEIFARRLNEAGIFTFADLLARTPDEIQGIVAPGRVNAMIDIEDWFAQARRLLGDTAPDTDANPS